MEVVSFSVAEVIVPNLIDVGSVGVFCDFQFPCIDELLEVVFVSFSPRLYGGGSAMVKRLV
jgi:hypothetical protein